MEFSKAGYILLNGVVMAQATQVRMRINSNDKPVKTLTGGLVGFTDGSEEASVDFREAVPLAGFEAEFTAMCRGHETVQIGVRIANKQWELIGRFIDTDIETDVDNPNMVGISFHGRVLSEISLY